MAETSSFVKLAPPKSDFHLSVCEALETLDAMYVSALVRRGALGQPDKSITDYVNEFIFCKVGSKFKRYQPLTATQQLQMCEVLREYFFFMTSKMKQGVLFLMLFPPAGNLVSDSTMCIMGKLISLAIGTATYDILDCAANWIQLEGTSSKNSKKLARMLVADYIILVPSSVRFLNDLHSKSPRFCCCFLTIVADFFSGSEENSSSFHPPEELLEIMAKSLDCNPQVALAAVNEGCLLPLKIRVSKPVSPLASMARLIVEAPLKDHSLAKSSGCAHLHLAVLKVVKQVYTQCKEEEYMVLLKEMYMQQLTDLVKSLAERNLSLQGDNAELVEMCLDRLAQLLHAFIATSVPYDSLVGLLRVLKELPGTRLMDMVREKCVKNGKVQ